MSKKSKTVSKKNSSKKQNIKQFKISPLILIIAVIEIIVLIGAVSYAWYVLANNNTVTSGTISVQPDSGLKIDFAHAEESGYINIQNYINDFEFEAATSTDGRNIFFPTTGSFNNTSTNKLTLREGTANDVNTKYISIDFTLTNEKDSPQKVFLNNKSSFGISGENSTGKALRIAFYQNDNKAGKITSDYISDNSDPSKMTVFFNDNLGWSTEQPCAYIWYEDPTGTITAKPKLADWPGTAMRRVSGDQYYITFDKTKEVDGVTYTFNHVIFNDSTGTASTSQKQTVDLDLSETGETLIYTPTTKVGGEGDDKDKYNCSTKSYDDLVSDTGYAVVAPDVSTGFQRPYAPVSTIDTATGAPTTIVSAFASAIDDYFNYDAVHDTGYLFNIGAHQTQYLSMIVWLEGTDPDCTASYYAGKNIDLNLVFATDSDSSSKYDYYFYDETLENWIDNEQKINGVDVAPVIQMYDKNLGRGFKMSLDGTRKIWHVNTDAAVAGHRIEFRRVNPMDENEIWNYWEAGTYINTATGNTVSDNKLEFTAFADGSPRRYYTNANKNSNPVDYESSQRSCGGLWGNFRSTQKLIAYDGTEGHFIHNSDRGGTNGALLIKYTIAGQTVEYKASKNSDTGNACYIFIVPDKVLDYADDSRPDVYFRRYYNMDESNAINSIEKNGYITLDESFSNYSGSMDAGKVNAALNGGKAMGPYFCISQDDDGAFADHRYCYWGSDLLVVQAENTVKDEFNSGNKWIQVKYYNKANPSSTFKYSYCFIDNNFKNASAVHGYASIVPCDANYDCFTVQSCNYGDHDIVYNQTAPVSTGTYDSSSYKWYATTTAMHDPDVEGATQYVTLNSSQRVDSSSNPIDGIYNNTLGVGNVISLRYFYQYLFLEIPSELTTPRVYAYGASANKDDAMTELKSTSGGYKLYYYCLSTPAYYSKYKFGANKDGTSTWYYWPSDYANTGDGKGKFYTMNQFLNYQSVHTYIESGFSVNDNVAYCVFNDSKWDHLDISR